MSAFEELEKRYVVSVRISEIGNEELVLSGSGGTQYFYFSRLKNGRMLGFLEALEAAAERFLAVEAHSKMTTITYGRMSEGGTDV